MSKSKSRQNLRIGIWAIAAGFILAASAALWVAFLNKNHQTQRASINETFLAQLQETSTTPSDNLATYLSRLNSESGCGQEQPGQHQLRIEYKEYAKVKYGCGETDATMYLHSTNGQWQVISPTNQFVAGMPLCSHVKEHNIPYVLYGEGCFEPTKSKDPLVVGQILAAPRD